jgi:hypothetical protein
MADATESESTSESAPSEPTAPTQDESVSIGGYEVPADAMKELDLEEGDTLDVKEFGIEDTEKSEADKDVQPDEGDKEEAAFGDEDLESLKKELDDEIIDEGKKDEEPEFEVNGEKLKKSELEAGYLKEKDYRQKTQSLAADRRSFEEEQSTFYKQADEWKNNFQEELAQKQTFDYLVEHIKTTDPDFYEQLQSKFQDFYGQTRNPYFESQLGSLAKQNEALQKELDSIREESEKITFNKQMNDLDNWVNVRFGKLKLKWDKNAVSKAWANQEGDKTPKEIFKELYGDQLLALAESKAKLAKVRGAAAKGPPTYGKTKADSAVASGKDNGKWKDMSYSKIVDELESGRLRI